MSAGRPFLARWSLRKHESRIAEPDREDQPGQPEPDAAPPADLAAADETDRQEPPALEPAGAPVSAGEAPPTDEPQQAFDLEGLGPDSDYRGFLDRSVPKAVRVAALRKAWSSDPAIAGYRPLADYDWDFNAPGYAALRPTDDPTAFISALFRHLKKDPEGPVEPSSIEDEADEIEAEEVEAEEVEAEATLVAAPSDLRTDEVEEDFGPSPDDPQAA